MRFHVGFSFRPKLSWLKWILLPLVGLFAYFGIFTTGVLAASGSLEASSVSLCNNATGSCSSSWLTKDSLNSSYLGGLSNRYTTMEGYSAISTFKVYFNDDEFSSFCYESNYNFHATYKMKFRLLYFDSANNSGSFSSILVYANNSRIPVRVSTNSDGVYTVSFDYPGYGTDIRIDFLQNGSNIGLYPLRFYHLIQSDITCLDQTTLSSVNQTIENSTNNIITNNQQNTQTIIENNNSNTQDIIDSQQEIKDSITDSNVASSSSKGANLFHNTAYNDHGLRDIVLAPVRLLQGVINSQNSCNDLIFNINMNGTDKLVSLPSGCILWDLVPSSVDTIFQIMVYGLSAYYILLDLFKFVNDLRDPDKKNEFTLDL